jgi:hypothetical protein
MRSLNSVIGYRTYYDNGHSFDSIQPAVLAGCWRPGLERECVKEQAPRQKFDGCGMRPAYAFNHLNFVNTGHKSADKGLRGTDDEYYQFG